MSNPKLRVDMWHGGQKEDADRIDILFYASDCTYRGNIYKDGKIIGDYVCDDSLTLERIFPQLVFNWGD